MQKVFFGYQFTPKNYHNLLFVHLYPLSLNYSVLLFIVQLRFFWGWFIIHAWWMTVRCWTSDHLISSMLIGFPLIILWVLLFPLGILYYIRKHKADLDNKEMLQLYGLFYVGLNYNTYCWEVIVINIRKIFLIMTATIMSQVHQNFKVIIVY